MRTVRRTTPASPEKVWGVLADGWTYPSWVVGASRMRAVSADWPGPGATLHHSVGTWPLVRDDETRVQEVEEGRRIVVEAHAQPAGSAVVEIVLTPDGEGTTVDMREDAVSGPSLLVPEPARQAAIAMRNREALRRMTLLAERADDPGDVPPL